MQFCHISNAKLTIFLRDYPVQPYKVHRLQPNSICLMNWSPTWPLSSCISYAKSPTCNIASYTFAFELRLEVVAALVYFHCPYMWINRYLCVVRGKKTMVTSPVYYHNGKCNAFAASALLKRPECGKCLLIQ